MWCIFICLFCLQKQITAQICRIQCGLEESVFRWFWFGYKLSHVTSLQTASTLKESWSQTPRRQLQALHAHQNRTISLFELTPFSSQHGLEVVTPLLTCEAWPSPVICWINTVFLETRKLMWWKQTLWCISANVFLFKETLKPVLVYIILLLCSNKTALSVSEISLYNQTWLLICLDSLKGQFRSLEVMKSAHLICSLMYIAVWTASSWIVLTGLIALGKHSTLKNTSHTWKHLDLLVLEWGMCNIYEQTHL